MCYFCADDDKKLDDNWKCVCKDNTKTLDDKDNCNEKDEYFPYFTGIGIDKNYEYILYYYIRPD